MSEGSAQPEVIACSNPECTVSESGTCVLGFDKWKEDCPEYQHVVTVKLNNDGDFADQVGDQEVLSPESAMKYSPIWPGTEIGLSDVERIMRSSYTQLIGILGLSDVGKTCFLSSLFLKACSTTQPLNTFMFGGSKTLLGFEERALRTRMWDDSNIPDTLADRTTLQDPRNPGFLHLKLAYRSSPTRPFDVIFTDLPGEWFRELCVNLASASRLEFLKRADSLILIIDAERLIDPSRRHSHIYMTKLLLARIRENIEPVLEIPIVLAISKSDVLGKPLNTATKINGVDEISAEAIRIGLNTEVIYIASYSRCPAIVENGHGIETVLSAALDNFESVSKVDTRMVSSDYKRSFARFGN